MSRPNGHPPTSAAATAAGVDHVLLSYRYLDDGDLDAYGSLFADDAQVNRPDVPHGQGRRRILDLHAPLAGPPSRHDIYKIVAQGDAVAVMGRLTRRSPAAPVDFADFFTLSGDGLLLGYRRFYFTPPVP